MKHIECPECGGEVIIHRSHVGCYRGCRESRSWEPESFGYSTIEEMKEAYPDKVSELADSRKAKKSQSPQRRRKKKSIPGQKNMFDTTGSAQ